MTSAVVATESGGTDVVLDARLRRVHLLGAALGIAWLVVSVAGIFAVSDRLLAECLGRTVESAERDTKALTDVVDRIFRELIAIPQVLSSCRDLRATVVRYNKLE